jgi:hypothetical protein
MSLLLAFQLGVVGKDSALVWNDLAAVGKADQFLWNDLTTVGKADQFLWNVATTAGKASQYVWNVQALAGKPVGLVWSVQAAVGKAADLRWNALVAVGDPLDVRWNVLAALAAVGDDLVLVWNVRSPGLPLRLTRARISHPGPDFCQSRARPLLSHGDGRRAEKRGIGCWHPCQASEQRSSEGTPRNFHAGPLLRPPNESAWSHQHKHSRARSLIP